MLNLKKRIMKLGFRMILDLGSAEQRSAYENGEWEGAAVRKCLEHVPDDGVMLDIGAHVGLFSCVLGMHLRQVGGTVHAFEPVGSNYRRLMENIALNDLQDTVWPNKLALGSEPGRIEMRIAPGSATNNAVGSNMLSEHDRAHVEREHWGHDWADVVRLDDWAEEADLHRCDLIKIDTEGADLRVLEGGRRTLNLFRPVILAEFNAYWMKQIGQSFDDVILFFDALKYQIFRDLDGRFLPLRPELVAKEPEVTNYLLLPEARIMARTDHPRQRVTAGK